METKEATSLQKKIFFDELYGLDEADDEKDTSSAALMSFRYGETCHELQDRPQLHQPSLTMEHTASRTRQAIPTPSRTGAANVEVIEDTPMALAVTRKGRQNIKKIFNRTTPVAGKYLQSGAPEPGPRASKKGKREKPLVLMPKPLQIFKGLFFYFFPNNDISPARRARIRKAMEWGAVWVKDWERGITHIIADSSLCYNDLLKYLKISGLPSGINLVDEIYPADCLKFRFVVNPNQVMYHVRGHQEAIKPAQSSTFELGFKSPVSPLLVKQKKKRSMQNTQTPTRSEGGEIELTNRIDTSNKASTESLVITGTSVRPHENPQDALDDAIEEARMAKELPLDLDEESIPSGVASDESDGSGSGRPSKRPRLNKGSLDNSRQQKFSCMQKHDGIDKPGNPNQRTIEVLQQMADYYDRTKDHWRLIAYRRAIAALRKVNYKIVTKEQAFAIPFIGERLAAKIEEIFWTHRLRQLENAILEPTDLSLQAFIKIYGVGYAQATLWVDQGHRTLGDLSTKVSLTKNQKIGIEHYHDFLQRIPRSEAAEHKNFVSATIHAVDPTIEVTIGGSYRRGASDCGDIDFIVTKPDCSPSILRTIIIDTVIPRLFAEKYLCAALAVTSQANGSKWHGAATLPNTTIWRRIDFLLVPWEEMGAALIYFTGNDIFNRSIRLLASKKGMRLNQRGLWKDVMGGQKRERITQGTLVESRSEEKIFELLGVPWRRPEHRIC